MDKEELKNLRDEIDALDADIIRALGKRFELVHSVRELKKAAGLPPLDERRWNEVIESRLTLAKKAALPPEFIMRLMNLIHDRSLEIEGS